MILRRAKRKLAGKVWNTRDDESESRPDRRLVEVVPVKTINERPRYWTRETVQPRNARDVPARSVIVLIDPLPSDSASFSRRLKDEFETTEVRFIASD